MAERSGISRRFLAVFARPIGRWGNVLLPAFLL
jgi:hypothetical protein